MSKDKESIFFQAKKTVAFIFKVDDEKKVSPYGTGFFVSVPVEKSSDRVSGYFVTAKHVLQDEKGNFLPEIVLRLNQRDGNATYAPYQLNPENILLHEENEVDIAVIPIAPEQTTIDYKFIQHDLISTPEYIKQNQIEEGDDVFFTGLFTSYLGKKKNHPIIRFGKVALMTDEKIDWKEKDKPAISTELYLVECQSFGGNSGSPIFFNLSPMRKPGVMSVGGSKITLAGVIKGSFLSANEIGVIGKTEELYSSENVGISAVTPAYKLKEILFSNDVIKRRNKPYEKT